MGKEAGGVLEAFGHIEAGRQANSDSRYLQKDYFSKANAELAAASVEVGRIRRMTRITESRARAVAAANGGDTTDEGVQQLVADIEREGEFQALSALYRGESRARDLRHAGRMARYEGKVAENQGRLSAITSVVRGFG